MSNQSYDEWIQERLDATKTSDVDSSVKIAIQAQVAAEKLTSDQNWDYFLSILGGFKEMAEMNLKEMDEKMWGPSVVSHEAMISIKMHHAYTTGLIEAVEQIMDVPRILVEEGEHAQSIVKEFKTTYDA